MKTKTFFIAILLILILMVMGSCEDKEPKYEIYKNHDISACGVEDPLLNIEWETVNPPNPSFEDFMKDKELVAELFHVINQ